MNNNKILKNCLLLTVLIAGQVAFAQQKDSTAVNGKKMKEVTVSGTRRQVVYRLDRKKIDASQVVTAAGGTAVEILSTLPSVQTDADGEVTFRGSSNFQVYIDGKPSPLEGTQALRMIPASSIQDIEILTTPSARYRTDGDVGIINITTIKGKDNGLSGLFNAGGSTIGSWNADGRLEYRQGRNKWWGSMQADRYRGASNFQQEKTTLVDDFLTKSVSDGTRFRTQRTYVGTAGWEHTIGNRHQVNVEAKCGEMKTGRGGDMNYQENRRQGDLILSDNVYDAHDRYELPRHLAQLAADYTWNINERGDQLSIQSRNRHDWYSLEYTESNLFYPNGSRYEGTRGYEKEYHWDCDEKADYKWQYRATGALETGYQYTTYSEIGGYDIRYWDTPEGQDPNWRHDPHAPFEYRRQIHSAYAMATDHFGPVDVDAGLRMDHTYDHMDINVLGEDIRRDNHRNELYPSAHVGYNTNKGTFTLGYSRRTNRPGIWKLEPYITYEDYYTKQIGNPDIKPEYIQSLELSYRKSFQGGHSITLTGYQRWRTGVVDVIRKAYEPGVTLDSIINAGNQTNSGMEFSGVAKPWKWWTSTANGHVQYYDFTPTYEGCMHRDGVCYEIGWINQFAVSSNTHIQFDTHVVGPHRLTQGREKAYCFFNLGAKQDLMQGKMTVALTATDVFHTARYRNWRTDGDALRSVTRLRPVYPNIALSLSYRFNAQHKEKAHGEEKNEVDYQFEGKDF